VRDPRLERLGELVKQERLIPVEIRVHDLCVSPEGGFQTAEIEAMKRMDLLALVLPAFLDPAPTACVEQLDLLVADLVLADLAAVEARLERAKKEKIAEGARRALEHVRDVLEGERPVLLADLSPLDREELRSYAMVTDRPWIAIRNAGEDEAGAPVPVALEARGAELACPVVAICASLEAEMTDLSPAEQVEFLAEYGVGEPAGAAITRAALERGERIVFFTIGDDDCRAWEIPRGTHARAAAGRVHSDMERGFIRAEVIPFEDFEQLGGALAEARKAGKLRLEGKDYEVRDGDIVRFRFNV
jgi:ribosome-binding ATPase YchF (GTP1/OBG family)